MEIKQSISVQSAVDFVNSVINVATIDGQYIPALKDYSIRVNAILFFTDYEFEKRRRRPN